ncbi:MAG: PAS domain-containing protein, partial [Holophagales bacterium]|nr:PAS domain-containing protein [Holophagales bacterium]
MSHPLLERQLDKLGLDDHKPPDASEWRMLLDRISDTYAEAYRQRYQLARSLALSTRRSEGQPEDAGRLEALRHERDHYRMLVESVPTVIFTLSAENGSFTSLNPAFEQLTGWPVEEW